MRPSCLYLLTTSEAQPINKPAGSLDLCPLRLYCYRVTNRVNCPMLKTAAFLLFAGAACSTALPASVLMGVAGASFLLLDHNR